MDMPRWQLVGAQKTEQVHMPVSNICSFIRQLFTGHHSVPSLLRGSSSEPGILPAKSLLIYIPWSWGLSGCYIKLWFFRKHLFVEYCVQRSAIWGIVRVQSQDRITVEVALAFHWVAVGWWLWLQVQLTLEPHKCELCRSTFRQIFFFFFPINAQLGVCIPWFHILGFN